MYGHCGGFAIIASYWPATSRRDPVESGKAWKTILSFSSLEKYEGKTF